MILVMHMKNIKFFLTNINKTPQSKLYLLKFEHYENDEELYDKSCDINFIDYDMSLLYQSLHSFADIYHRNITNLYFIFQEKDTLYDIATMSSKFQRLYNHIQNYNINSIGEMI